MKSHLFVTLLLGVLSSYVFALPKEVNHQEVVIPEECDVIPEWTVTYFEWYNSTHNLDCVKGPDIGDGTTCFNSTLNGTTFTCDPSLGPCQTCGVPACYTGLPAVPLGYGPPDSVIIIIENGYSCYQTNPQTLHRAEVGEGYVFCGGTAYYLNFYGNSNHEFTKGHIDYNPLFIYNCANGSTITASGSVDFPILCTYDEGNNATCTAGEFVIPITGYTIT